MMWMMWRFVLVAVCCFSAAAAHAQAWPSRAIRVIVPYAPGGTTDIVGRQMGQKLSEALGQPVVIENRTGGNTAIGADAVAKAAPDGYTVLFTNDATFVLNPVLFPSLTYNASRDFVPVATVTYVALGLVVNASIPANNLKELVAYIQARKGTLGYASFGAGSQPHLMGEMFKKLTDTDLIHVPYKGAGPAVTDLIAGQVPVMFADISAALGHIRSGKLRALGVTTRERSALLDVPTVIEQGIPDFDVNAWFGLLAPAGTPPEVVLRLSAESAKALRQPALRERLQGLGLNPAPNSPEEFGVFIRGELERWAKVARAVNIRAE
jgi:tripartite-type tricarboxylate transporter receptor subunit TctC